MKHNTPYGNYDGLIPAFIRGADEEDGGGKSILLILRDWIYWFYKNVKKKKWKSDMGKTEFYRNTCYVFLGPDVARQRALAWRLAHTGGENVRQQRQNRKQKREEQERKSRWEARRPGNREGRPGGRWRVRVEEEEGRGGGGGGGGGGGWIQADPCVCVCCCVSQWVSSALAPAGNASTKQRQYTHHPPFTPIQSPLMRVTLYMPSAPHRSYQAAV